MRLFTQVKNHSVHSPLKDVLAGVIVALVSIPIGMGYAQIAGLPAVYGLYGSLLPILVFGLLTTSPMFVVGVDAMPAVMVGTCLAQLGVAAESEAALQLVPLMSLLVAGWFIVFYFAKAGRVVKYISTPVMGGFISGVGVTIILMQIPKLFGGTAGTGELFPLLWHLYESLPAFHPLSCVLGVGTVAVILMMKKFKPAIPMTVIMMGVGALLQYFLQLDRYGVKVLPQIESGLPVADLPSAALFWPDAPTILLETLSIAGVIMAQTLLASGNYAMKYGDKLDNNKELLAYAGMNAAGALVGSCPINGSVSRSGIADSFGTKSQLMSLSAAVTMLLVLLFGTGLLQLLPVPVLTGIVITALIGIIDTKLCKRLWKTCRNEWVVFAISFLGVLLLGTVNGVLVGCVLSFGEVAVRAVTPPTDFMGRIPGHGNYHSLRRNTHARPICGTIIYRFSGNLFFANIDRFERDIEQAIKEDTKIFVVDGRGIGTIDITAVDRLVILNRSLRERGIKFYLTEHPSSLNDQLRALGGISLLEEGVIRRTISLALRDAGLEKPYPLEGVTGDLKDDSLVSADRLAEFEWAFGDDAERKLEELADEVAAQMIQDAADHTGEFDVLENHGATTKWGMIGLFDEQELWDHIEERLEELVKDGVIPMEDAEWIENRIEERRASGLERLQELNPQAIELLNRHRENVLAHFQEKDPEGYEHVRKVMEKRLKK